MPARILFLLALALPALPAAGRGDRRARARLGERFDIRRFHMALLDQGQPVHFFENRYRHRNGHYRLLTWSAHSVLESGLVFNPLE